MGGFVKWVFGIAGWALGEWVLSDSLGWMKAGPVCGITGFIIGTVIDSLEIRFFRKKHRKKTAGKFATSLLMLIAAVMKAERPVAKAKVDSVKQFLKENFGEKGHSDAFIQLKDILKQNIQLNDACAEISSSIDYSSRLQLAHFLYSMANVDGKITDAEKIILNIITKGLRVTLNSKQSVGVALVQNNSIIAAYDTLGINGAVSVIDIKKAYRNLAVKYHPDKVAFMDEEQKKVASNKFQELTHAYEIIKKERKFS